MTTALVDDPVASGSGRPLIVTGMADPSADSVTDGDGDVVTPDRQFIWLDIPGFRHTWTLC